MSVVVCEHVVRVYMCNVVEGQGACVIRSLAGAVTDPEARSPPVECPQVTNGHWGP